jgi:gamma-glutamyltranspeptidase
LITDHGRLFAALATRGGHLQPQVLLQLTARALVAGQSPAECTAAPRWAVAEGELVVEGHAPEAWLGSLRGATVSPPFAETFGEAQLIVRHEDHLAAASDPRGTCWGVATL